MSVASRRPFIGVLSALLLAAVVVAPNAQAETRSFTYVAATTVGGSRSFNRETPAGSLAATGWFEFTSASSTFTLRIDDVGALDGQTVPVMVWQERGDGTWSSQHSCVPVRVTRTPASIPGATVIVLIASETYWLGTSYDLHCSGLARAGVAYVGQ